MKLWQTIKDVFWFPEDPYLDGEYPPLPPSPPVETVTKEEVDQWVQDCEDLFERVEGLTNRRFLSQNIRTFTLFPLSFILFMWGMFTANIVLCYMGFGAWALSIFLARWLWLNRPRFKDIGS